MCESENEPVLFSRPSVSPPQQQLAELLCLPAVMAFCRGGARRRHWFTTGTADDAALVQEKFATTQAAKKYTSSPVLCCLM